MARWPFVVLRCRCLGAGCHHVAVACGYSRLSCVALSEAGWGGECLQLALAGCLRGALGPSRGWFGLGCYCQFSGGERSGMLLASPWGVSFLSCVASAKQDCTTRFYCVAHLVSYAAQAPGP